MMDVATNYWIRSIVIMIIIKCILTNHESLYAACVNVSPMNDDGLLTNGCYC